MKKILAIGAHPDDVEFGAAGLIIKEIAAGAEAKIVICSLGEAGTNGTPEGRRSEAEAAAKHIGASFEYVQMGGDCHLSDTPENRIKLASVIREWKPDIVLAPSLSENQHPDHVAVAQMARAAVRLARYGGLGEIKAEAPHVIEALYYYPSGTELDRKPDIIVDVSAHYEKWAEAMNMHESQMKTRGYINLVSTKAKYMGAVIGVEYAIPLWTNDPVRVESLTELGSSRKYR